MHRYVIVLYCHDGSMMREVVEAETYWEALTELNPGNDLMKIEIIEIGRIDS